MAQGDRRLCGPGTDIENGAMKLALLYEPSAEPPVFSRSRNAPEELAAIPFARPARRER